MPHPVLILFLAILAPNTAQADTKLPTNVHLMQDVYATGVQIYSCEAGTWNVKGPEADLFNAEGQKVGTHFAGPSWKNNDSGLVVGEVVAKENSPKNDDIPWLLLKAKSHEGSGAWSAVAYVRRIDTNRGVAPKDGCEPGVPYKATYQFYAE